MQQTQAEQGITELDFSPLTVDALSEITPILKESGSMLCDYTPGGLLFGIRELYSPQICLHDGRLFVSVLSEDGLSREFLMPTGDAERSLDMLYSYTKKNNIPFIFGGITKDDAETAARHFGCEYEITDRLYDYVYDAESLASLKGSKYHTHRTNIRKLERQHESYSYKRIEDAADIETALAFADELFSGEEPVTSKYWQAGKDIVYDSLKNLNRLCMRAGILCVDGMAAGVAVGFIKHETLYIHVLRAKREIWGAWNLLCREFVSDSLSEIKYVNMEDDLESDGIRRMKMSYAPIDFIRRCRINIT